MSSSASVVSVQAWPDRLFDARRFEGLKWVAFVAMVLDHVSLIFGAHDGVLYQVGRVAFPLFAISFGVGLAASSSQRRVLLRLLLPGLLAEIAWRASGHYPGVNVLLSFCLVGIACALFERSWTLGLGLLLIPAALPGFESGFLVPLLVGSSYFAARFRSPAAFVVVLVSSALVLGTVGAALASLLLLLCPAVRLPRFRHFAWAYAAHLVVLVCLARL